MMATQEERMRILQMVQDGKIGAEEGARLLETLEAGTPSSTTEATVGKGKSLPRKLLKGRWFRVRVTDTKNGRAKATVNIPLGLMEWGLKIGAQFAPEVGNIDLSELSEMLQQGEMGKIVDVVDEEDGEHVEIFIE